MGPVHKTCYWNYTYGDEYEACPECRQQLLDAEELFCFGAYTDEQQFTTLPPWPYPCCHGRCPCGCHCPDFWAEIFRQMRDRGDGTCRLLPDKTTPEEFGCLYHEGYCRAFRITQNEADAHDAVQTAFFKIHRMPENPRHLRGMFYRAVDNAALDIVRKRKRYVPIDEQRLPERGMCRDATVAHEESMSLAEAMDGLPSGDQMILRMHYVEGMSHEQIAEQLGVPRTTVNMRLAAARRRLKKKLLRGGAFAGADR